MVVEREFGKRVRFEQLTDFNVGDACGLSTAQSDELYRIVHEPEELLQMQPIDAALRTLRRWTDAGYEVAIVTGRPPDTCDSSRAWLERHHVAHHSFTMVNKYGRFTTNDTVAISLEELRSRRYLFAVEDSLPMARFLGEQMRLPVALLDNPWNVAFREPLNVTRFVDWPAIGHALPPQPGKPVNFL